MPDPTPIENSIQRSFTRDALHQQIHVADLSITMFNALLHALTAMTVYLLEKLNEVIVALPGATVPNPVGIIDLNRPLVGVHTFPGSLPE